MRALRCSARRLASVHGVKSELSWKWSILHCRLLAISKGDSGMHGNGGRTDATVKGRSHHNWTEVNWTDETFAFHSKRKAKMHIFLRFEQKLNMEKLTCSNGFVAATRRESLTHNVTVGLWKGFLLQCKLKYRTSYGQFRRYLKNHLFGIWEITAQLDAWYPALYKYSYLLTYLLTY